MGADSSDPNYAYIKNKIIDLVDAIFSEDGKLSDGSSYLDHIDVGSFVKYYWHQEFIANQDFSNASTYFYKDRDSIDPKLYAGPIWDSDNMLKATEGWYAKTRVCYNDGTSPTIYNRLMQRRDFVSYVIWYYENTDLKKKMAEAANVVNGYSEEMMTASQMDYIKWNTNVFNPTDMNAKLSKRASWVDEHYLELKEDATAGEWIDLTNYDPNAKPKPPESDAAAEFTYTSGTPSTDLDVSLGNKGNGYRPLCGRHMDSILTASVTGTNAKTLEWSKAEYTVGKTANVSVPVLSASDKNPWADQTVSPAYIQIEVPAAEYEALAVSAKLGATKKGPKNYALLYSLDNTNYVELKRYSLQANKTLEQAFNKVSVPVNNAKKVYFRIQPIGNETVGGTLLSDNPGSGEMAFNDIIIAPYQPPIMSVSDVKQTDNRLTANISLTGAADGTIYIAAYDKGDRLAGLQAYEAAETVAMEMTFSNAEPEYVRILWWGKDMAPKTTAVQIDMANITGGQSQT